MNEIKVIPIASAEAADGTASSRGNAIPLLREIEILLADLLAAGKSGSIDLRSLPMLDGDYAELREVLGRGEVDAVVDANGPTRISETAIHGVWWVTHYNSDETVVAEFLEVAHVPEILHSHPADVRRGLETLRARLARFR